MGQVRVWLLWYAEQPWPGSLLVKQLGLELLSSLVIGLTIAFTAGPSRMHASAHEPYRGHPGHIATQ